MPRVTTIVRKPAVKADRVVDTITLDHEARNRRQGMLKGERGTEILLDLDMETTVNDGDALRLEDGRLVQVRAAAEPLLEVKAENPLRLTRLAWHLGSSHGLVEVTADALYVENNPAVAELVRGQGCTATPVERPFRPERSAHVCDHDHGHHHHGHGHSHAESHSHAHAHSHDHHDHGHDHAHEHEHDHDHHHDHAHHHEHGPGCGCGHHHGHKHDH
ncbi:urease accessory protein UreE [Microvirga sp. CF3016]|uniref:urease accessory protein UreE n=1 Tax=Microvirga sp. CF3016 TaxID=3110181 RepID=UPI002E7A9972|nr:urease accessory protein UreE [Microvirga sp. CF3016]MEE1611192.1 urease accessory protein UreE [Microvirga sp. CF3016]